MFLLQTGMVGHYGSSRQSTASGLRLPLYQRLVETFPQLLDGDLEAWRQHPVRNGGLGNLEGMELLLLPCVVDFSGTAIGHGEAHSRPMGRGRSERTWLISA